jgi:hypothetical protein
MKRIFLSVIFMTIFASFLGKLSAISEDSQNTHTQIKNYYENMINETISKCHSKAQLRESKSANLQSCAAVKLKKANFLSKNKEMLINEMVKKAIDAKQYKIEYFLNKKFREYSNIANSQTIRWNIL